LGKTHFWFTFLGFLLVFGGQLLAGYSGQHRRLYDPFAYQYLQPLRALNKYTSWAAFALFFGQLAFIWNFFHSMVRGRKAEANPWQVGTLEWSVPSPPPIHNFDHLPIVRRGPHELSAPEIRARLGRDWIGQAEVLPGERDVPATGASVR
jgi:cytochrome c oxidase subunit 1